MVNTLNVKIDNSPSTFATFLDLVLGEVLGINVLGSIEVNADGTTATWSPFFAPNYRLTAIGDSLAASGITLVGGAISGFALEDTRLGASTGVLSGFNQTATEFQAHIDDTNAMGTANSWTLEQKLTYMFTVTFALYALNFFGGAGNDLVEGGPEADYLQCNAGNDTVLFSPGDDTILGGAGIDLFDFSNLDSLGGVDCNLATHSVSVGAFTQVGKGVENIAGTSSGDSFTGDAKPNVIYGGDGADTISGRAGNDSINGEGGNDVLYGNADDDQIFGGSDDDKIYGNGGNDDLIGEAGMDSIFGQAGDDFISGLDGNDVLRGGAQNDHILGGNDNDTIKGGKGSDTISGDAGDDSIAGQGGFDSITGGMGKDTINGNDGNDTIAGGPQDDLIAGFVGADLIRGGPGNDSLGGLYPFGGSLSPNDGADTIFGGPGKDLIFASNGKDRLFGQKGADQIYGEYGADKLFGGGGRDTIAGDKGNDVITGGDGGDRFEFDAYNFQGNDRIKDMTSDDQIFIRTQDVHALSLDQAGGAAVITYGGGSITLDGVDHTNLLAEASGADVLVVLV